MKKTKDM